MGTIRIGVSGWTYPEWRGRFYPDDVPKKRELEYAAGCFDTLEINGSFYSLQRASTYAGWYERTPADTVLAVKGPQFLTHRKRLREPATPLANFLASGVLGRGASRELRPRRGAGAVPRARRRGRGRRLGRPGAGDAYFDNDAEAHAPYAALALRGHCGVG